MPRIICGRNVDKRFVCTGNVDHSSQPSTLLNVSRTRVPESWLSSLATKPSVGYNALDKGALATLEKSRFSVSTIDSELFPELLSWSALMNTLPTAPCAQSIPIDIAEPGDADPDDTTIVHEATSSLSLILDPTALEFDFDQSCFDGLDSLLIHHPLEAFAEVCWLDAVGPPSTSMRASTPTQLLNKPSGRRKLPTPPVMSPLFEERYTDEHLTYKERTPLSAMGIGVTSSASSLHSEQKSAWSTREKRLSSVSSDEATSFILFEAPLFSPNRYNPVGHFPMPSRRPPRNVSNRIATFCSQI